MNRMLYMLLGLIGLFSLSGLILAQGSSGFFLPSANSTGGGGSSENGRFSLHGTIEQQANSSLSGGSYTVRHFEEWQWQKSVYTRHGDWFVALCGFFVLASLGVVLRHRRSKATM